MTVDEESAVYSKWTQRRSSCSQGIKNKSEFTRCSHENLDFIGRDVTMNVSRPGFVYRRKRISNCSQLNNFQLNKIDQDF